MNRRKLLVIGNLSVLTLFSTVEVVRAQVCPGWVEKPPSPGAGRLVFDSARGVCELLANHSNTLVDEHWKWDGVDWILRGGTPMDQFRGQASFDSDRNVIVAYDAPTETWEWNGATWSLKSSTGPSSRSNFAMAYDSIRHVTVLHGGTVGSNETWEWNGTVWTLRSTLGPSTTGIFLAFDDARGVAVLVDTAGQTWEWNGAAWIMRSSSGPSARTGHGLAYDLVRNVTVLFGGSAGPNETWEWNGTTWTLRSTAGPSSEFGGSMTFDTVNNVILMQEWGSYSSDGDITALWAWNGVSWQKLDDGAPIPRWLHGMCFDTARGVSVVFGGLNSGPGPSGTWEYDGDAWTRFDGTEPSPRYRMGMVYDEARSRTVLFGGSAGGNETWERVGTDWVLRATTGPEARYDHGMAYDSARGVSVVFGGLGASSGVLGDTWEWNGSTWSLRSTTGPGPRYGQVMSYDSIRGVTVLFGGQSGGFDTEFGDTWEWDGSTWELVATTGPKKRYWQSMAFDPTHEVTLMTGGWTGTGQTFPNPTWAWDGAAWTQLGSPVTFSRAAGTMAYDTVRQTAVAFGGWSGNYHSDIWELNCICQRSFVLVPEPRAGCTSGDCYAPKNRYLTFTPPFSTCSAEGFAIQVTLGPLPGPGDCPKIPDFSAYDGLQLWVGPERFSGLQPTGIHGLQTFPYYGVWKNEVLIVSDCNVVPCATYRLTAVASGNFPDGPFAPQIELRTADKWGDIVGIGGTPGDGMVNALDVVGMVDQFRGVAGAPPRPWCDLFGNSPTQGAKLSIDALDIVSVVDAFRGFSYPFSGPSAPLFCP